MLHGKFAPPALRYNGTKLCVESENATSCKAFLSYDILSEIMQHMSIEELRVMGVTHTSARMLAKTILRGRYQECIRRFIGKDVVGLNAVLLATGAVIVGSAARYILSAPCIWRPRDLNIIVPNGKQGIVTAYLLSNQFMRINEFNYSRIHTCSVERYESPTCIVTIEESLTESIFPVVLSRMDTSLALIVTSFGFIDFYPLLSLAGIRLCNRHRTTFDRDVKVTHMGMATAGSTIVWQTRCGSACPRINRRVCLLADAQFMDWSEGNPFPFNDKIMDIARRSHYKWRLGGQCFNNNCPMCYRL